MHVNLDGQAKVAFGFSVVKLLSTLFPFCTLQKEVITCGPQLRWGEFFCISLRAEYLHEQIRIPLHGRLVSFLHSFTYYTICLYQFGLADIYFILWVITKYCFIYFLVQIVSAFSIASRCPFDRPPSLCLLVKFFVCLFWALAHLLVMLLAWLVYFLLKSWNRPFSRGDLVPFIGERCQKQELSARCARCC